MYLGELFGRLGFEPSEAQKTPSEHTSKQPFSLEETTVKLPERLPDELKQDDPLEVPLSV